MKKLLTLLALSCIAACASTSTPPATSEALDFPAAWVGAWRGSLDWHTLDGESNKVDMQVEIHPLDDPNRFSWTIIYDGEMGRQVRPYELIVRDPERGEYAIDEKNGIILEATLLGDTFYSWFEVGGTRIVTRERLEQGPTGDRWIAVEMLSARSEPHTVTGEGIAVSSFLATTLQRGRLERIGDE